MKAYRSDNDWLKSITKKMKLVLATVPLTVYSRKIQKKKSIQFNRLTRIKIINPCESLSGGQLLMITNTNYISTQDKCSQQDNIDVPILGKLIFLISESDSFY